MDWIATGRARERRANPRLILPECKSILVLGIAYPPSTPSRAQAAGWNQGRIASYALGVDYHDVLPPRLQAIVAFIEMQIGEPIPNRCYTDTGPILERELAQRSLWHLRPLPGGLPDLLYPARPDVGCQSLHFLFDN